MEKSSAALTIIIPEYQVAALPLTNIVLCSAPWVLGTGEIDFLLYICFTVRGARRLDL